MRSVAFKWVILSATLLLAALVAFQLYWLKRIYNTEQQQFTINVMRSVRGLMEDVPLVKSPVRLNKVVDRPDKSSFVLAVDSIPHRDSLVSYLAQELEDFDVMTDCRAAMFDRSAGRYAYEAYLPSAGSVFTASEAGALPVQPGKSDYLLLYFPHHDKYLMHEMRYWIVGIIFLLLLLIGLVISLFYLYRQKFLNELQKDFVNNFTHEFKTPLAVMKIASDVLMDERNRNQPERTLKYTAIIQEQTLHLQRQVDRLLRAAQSRKAMMRLEKQEVDLNLLVRQAVQQLEPLVRERKGEVQLVPEEGPALIHADPEHLQLVVVNLVENGLKYSNEPRITITTRRVNGHYSISVKDNGIGIDQKYLGRLFHKFYRVPTGDVHNVKGFGLGLDFVKKVVQAHNGRVQVRSIPGVGSEFEIILPA